MIEVTIPGVPLPWKAPFVSTKGAFSVRTPIMNQFKDQIRAQLDEKFLEKGEMNWFTEAVAADLIFLMPIPKATSKKKTQLMLNGPIRPEKRPDRGNLLKLIEDVLQGVLIEDDSLVVDGRVAKYHSLDPKTIVRVYPIHEYELKHGRLWSPS